MGTVRRRLSSEFRNERGSAAAIMAVFMMGMLALAALGVDLAALRDARAEAQKAADAIALAGASAFRDMPYTSPGTVDEARQRAKEVARDNKVWNDTLYIQTAVWQKNALGSTAPLGEYTDSMRDVVLNIIPDSQLVRAWVRRQGIRTFFGKLLGKPFSHVQAKAAAWSTDEGPTVDCLKPFVMPDMWYESDTVTQDVNKNHYMDPITTVVGNTQDGESWKFQPASIGGNDYYIPYDPDTPPPPGKVQTGYGSPLRSAATGYQDDVGLKILLKPQTGSGNTKPTAERMGNAFWMLNLNPDLDFKTEVTSNCGTASIGDSVPYDNGSKTAVRQAIDQLVQQDPGARWDDATHQIVGSSYPDWTQSPRVVIVGLISPEYWIANSANTKPDPGSKFTNFVRIFFEPIDPTGPPENIHARYIGPAPGGGGGPTGGPLVKILQLVE